MIEDQKLKLKHIFKSRNYQFNQSIKGESKQMSN